MKQWSRRRWAPPLALAFITACGDNPAVPAPEDGAFVGRWDGRLWLGDATAFLSTGRPQGDVLFVFGSSPRGAGAWGAEETLRARVVFTGPGLYTLAASDVSFLELTGGDVIAAEYNGTGSPAGFLRISRYDGPNGVIEGTLEFNAATRSAHASYGPTAQLEDGQFHAVVTAQPSQLRAP